MAKVLKIAAEVVGAVALIASGVGVAFGGAILGVSLTTIGTIAGVAATALNIGAAALAKPPGQTQSGNQDTFTANVDQGVPIALGRTAVAGFLVHRQTWDWAGSTPPNAFQTFFGVWSGAGPIKAIESFQVNGSVVTFSGDIAQGAYNDGHNNGWMWLRTQLGQTPEPAALQATGFYPYPSGWSAQAKMSGYAAFAWTLKFDPKGKAYPGAAVPQPRAVLHGVLAWDPRKDDTYPGGSGPQRADNPATWDFTENPFVLALQWARGWWQNGIRVAGMGLALAAIDLPSAVYAANIADTNNWKAGGVVYSTDGKWEALKKICAAGSGEPQQLGGMLSFAIDSPKVSLATITDDDIIGKCTIPGAPRMADKLNGCVPTYREESQDWQLVPATKVQVPAYIAADGRPRTKAVTWELVQQVAQVAQLAAYTICNSREIDGFVVPLKLRWIGYKPGDALTIASSTIGMENQLVLVRKRHLDPATCGVTMTLRTETTGKHDFALGKTTTPPPAPALQAVDRTELLQPGISAAWSAVADDNGGRPEDNATNSADPNSRFGDRTVRVVIADLAQVQSDLTSATNDLGVAVPSLLDLAQSVATLNAYHQAKTTLDGKPIGTVTAQLRTVTESAVEDLSLIGARSAAGDAWLINLDTVKVDANTTLAQHFTSLQAYTDQKAAAVTTSLTQVITSETEARAEAIDALTANFNALGASVTDYRQASADAYTALSQRVDGVSAQLGGPDGISAKVALLFSAVVTAGGGATAKAVLSLNANGHVSGLIATNNGAASTLDLDFDRTRIFRSDGTLLLRAGDTGAGEDANSVYMPNVVVDRLRENLAVVPKFARLTAPVQGSGAEVELLRVTITLTERGVIEVGGGAVQSFSATPRSWKFFIYVDDETVWKSGGTEPGDDVAFFGMKECDPGQRVVRVTINTDSAITIEDALLIAKGFNNTGMN